MADPEKAPLKRTKNKKAKGEEDLNALDGLAEMWEKNDVIRRRLLKTSSLLTWPRPACVGVVSFEALSLNVDVFEAVIDVWASDKKKPKTLPINPLKRQARYELLSMVVSGQVRKIRINLRMSSNPASVMTESQSIKQLFTLLKRRNQEVDKRKEPCMADFLQLA